MSTTQSGSRARTRRAIIDAAGTLLAERSGASLAEIAEAARVGRSTLHRYFPDRARLIAALAHDLTARIDRMTTDAGLDEGTARAAMRRLLSGYFDLGPAMMFALRETQRSGDGEWLAATTASYRPVERLLERGRADGEFDPSLSTDWVRRALWSLMAAAWEAIDEKAMSRHQAAEAVTRTLEQGVLASRR